MMRALVGRLSAAAFTDRAEFETRYRQSLAEHGYVHVTDVPDEFDHAGYLSRFGEFLTQPSGRLIDEVKPEHGMDDVYYGMNRRALRPHTEGYEYAGLPPRYLALWCVTPAARGGETTILDAAPLVHQLSEADRKYLEEQQCEWVASEGLQRRGFGRRAVHPMLEKRDGNQVLRFSCNNISVPAPEGPIPAFLSRVEQFFKEHHIGVRLERHDLLHWDNWRVLHSRNAFDDPQRHLKRVQIQSRPAGVSR